MSYQQIKLEMARYVGHLDSPRCTVAARACLAPHLIVLGRIHALENELDEATASFARAVFELDAARRAALTISVTTAVPGEHWAMSLEAWHIEAIAFHAEVSWRRPSSAQSRGEEEAFAAVDSLSATLMDESRAWDAPERVAIARALAVRGRLAGMLGHRCEKSSLERAVALLSATVWYDGRLEVAFARQLEGAQLLAGVLVDLAAAEAAAGNDDAAKRLAAMQLAVVRALPSAHAFSR